MTALGNNPSIYISKLTDTITGEQELPSTRSQAYSGLDPNQGISFRRVNDCAVISESASVAEIHQLIFSPLPSVSVPSANVHRLAATAAALPELLPPGFVVKL